jgi:hypothetical protein
MIPSNPNNLPPVEWAFQHLQVIGWPALVYVAWKVSSVFQKFMDQLEKTTSQIDTMAENHFPHMEKSLATQDVLLHSVNESLKEIATNTGRRRTADYSVDGNRQ